MITACSNKMWPNGDQRLAGERGGALSGGQKVRVSLARFADNCQQFSHGVMLILSLQNNLS